MEKEYLLKFYEKINTFNDFDHLKALLRLNLAPTMSGLKTGTMVNLTNGNKLTKDMWEIYKDHNEFSIPLNYVELRESKNTILILFYNEKLLLNRLEEKEVKNFLTNFGYENCKSIEDHLKILKNNFKQLNKCPNEVGIFLGYPLEDVVDFHCSKDECKLIGYWRYYNNENFAREEFRRYDLQKQKVIKDILFCDKRAV